MNELSVGVSPGTEASIMLDKLVVGSYTFYPCNELALLTFFYLRSWIDRGREYLPQQTTVSRIATTQ